METTTLMKKERNIFFRVRRPGANENLGNFSGGFA